ncbi:MAG: FAD:protein FMN transferase [Terriglobia bacterium]
MVLFLLSPGYAQMLRMEASADAMGSSFNLLKIDGLYPDSGHLPQSGEAILRDQSLPTSGTSENFFTAEGKTWSHLMDPRRGFPSQGTLSVSVISPRTLDSEAWAKPYFINGRQWTAAHKPHQRVFYCDDKAEQRCAWLQ